MKISIWIPRESVWSLNTWLKTSLKSGYNKLITFFHDKPVKRMDLIQVSIDVEEYQKIIDNNEEIENNMAEQLGWKQTATTSSPLDYLPPHDYQLGN
jgi:hypothetical protein|tara:strand:- start:722 stop:1012 length:291 start_codon:yes stop_codon:yes gene_type:complete